MNAECLMRGVEPNNYNLVRGYVARLPAVVASVVMRVLSFLYEYKRMSMHM